MATGAMTYRMLLFFCFNKQSLFFQVFQNRLPAFITVHALILAGLFIHRSVFIHDNDCFQTVALSHFKVVRIVGRCDFYTACAIFHIDIFIGNNRNFSAVSGQFYFFADKCGISFIIRIDCHRRITGNRLRSCCCNLYITFFSHYRIIDIPEMSVFIFMLHFNIRKCGLTAGTPVRYTEPLINQTFFIKGNKNLTDRFGTNIVHCKPFTAPITGRTEMTNLVTDCISVFFFPCPNTFQEFFTSQVIFGQTLFGNLLFYLDLGSNPCMIFPGEPKNIVPLHSFVTDKNILERIIKSMSHMKLSRNVRRRQHNAVWFFFRIRLIMKYAVLFPELIPFLLNFTGIIFPEIFFIFHSIHSLEIKNSFIRIGRKRLPRYHLHSPKTTHSRVTCATDSFH